MPLELIIDTDAGIDDAQAILLALGQPDVQVVAITTVSGNVHVDKVTRNVFKTLAAAGKQVPVYRGADRPLLNPFNDAEDFHGKDGLGDANLPEAPGQVESEHAALALTRLAAANPGRYTLVAIGPLTNVALATRLDPAFPENLARLVFMGGAYEARGNINIVAEYNIHTDPEAAAIVLNTFPRTTMVSWELSVNHIVTWTQFDEIIDKSGRRVAFFNTINAHLVKYHVGQDGIPMPDPIAVAVAIDPRVVTEEVHAHVQVELHGALTRGQTVTDWKGGPRANVITKIDTAHFWKMMRQSLGAD
ncbi:MAG: nucleoside hydrolase [Chloroflexota bacterium]